MTIPAFFGTFPASDGRGRAGVSCLSAGIRIRRNFGVATLGKLTLEIRAVIEADLVVSRTDPLPLRPETIAHWRGVLPDLLIEVWEDYGLIKIAGGRMQLIAPNYLDALVSHITGDDADLGGDTHAIAIGDLGEVVLWSGRHGFGFLSPQYRAIYMPHITNPRMPPADQQIAEHVLRLHTETIEARDPGGKPVYARLEKQLGALPPLCIYGTTPVPPPLEGTPVDHYVIADACDWLEATYTSGIVVDIIFDWTRADANGEILHRALREPWPPGIETASRRTVR